jgi:uncharacterized BrkB/YihY/UPF0761 family membrane protein
MVKHEILPGTLGLISIVLVAYFWLALLMPQAWQPVFPGAGFVVVGCLLLSIVTSAWAAWLGSRRWYLATVAALGTLVFFGFRMR